MLVVIGSIFIVETKSCTNPKFMNSIVRFLTPLNSLQGADIVNRSAEIHCFCTRLPPGLQFIAPCRDHLGSVVGRWHNLCGRATGQ